MFVSASPTTAPTTSPLCKPNASERFGSVCEAPANPTEKRSMWGMELNFGFPQLDPHICEPRSNWVVGPERHLSTWSQHHPLTLGQSQARVVEKTGPSAGVGALAGEVRRRATSECSGRRIGDEAEEAWGEDEGGERTEKRKKWNKWGKTKKQKKEEKIEGYYRHFTIFNHQVKLFYQCSF